MAKQLEKGSKKLLNAWAFYDWANSVYSLTISSAIFPIYYSVLFKQYRADYIHVFGMDLKDTALITYVTAAAFLVVAIMSPLLSGIADFVGNKKMFLNLMGFLFGRQWAPKSKGNCISMKKRIFK